MNYNKTEEKLIAIEAKLIQITKKSSEQLKSVEKVKGMTFKTPEHLSALTDALKLPLRVTGKMLGTGRHKERYYTEESLKWSVDFHKNLKFPIKYDHKHRAKNANGAEYEMVSTIIGQVDKIWYDEALKAVLYEGHINNETFARNVLDESITEVSASISSLKMFDSTLGIVGKDPEYEELSLVSTGAFTGNTITAV